MRLSLQHIAMSAAIATLIGCGGSGGSSNGSLNVGVTDAPVDGADAVVVTFDSITVKPAEGERLVFELETPASINLLDYQGDERVLLLDGQSLPAGDYVWMRLGVIEEDSYIEVDGQQHLLEIPSGAQSGLKMNRSFTVASGGLTDFTIDVDLKKSVHMEGTGDYKLRPTLRITNNMEVGHITGTVAESLIIDEACVNNGDNNDIGNSVYVFEGLDQIPQDIQMISGDPIASANVNYNAETELYEFTIGFIPTGDYTVAFTCDGSVDMPDTDDSATVAFGDPQNISVAAGEDTVVSFE